MRRSAATLALAALLPLRVLAAASPADRAIAAAEARLARPAASADDHVALAAAFLAKARESGDGGWYARAGAAVDRALALDPASYEALRTRSSVLLGLHEFVAARAVAEEARAREPDDWRTYGTLADADVELGDYGAAHDALARMMDLRPGLAAYTRAAFLRSLNGDRAGALELLGLALDAASPRDPESLAWTLVQLGHEHFAEGHLAAAASAYVRALEAFPDHYLALGGLARVRAAEGRHAEAIALYRRAVGIVPAPDLVAALGDVCAAAGDAAEAERQYALVEYIGRVAAATGTMYGRQLALFFADHDRRLDEALRLARAEAAARADVYTLDALAWVLYKNGRLPEAARAAHRALRLGTEDAMLRYHEGLIAAALGRRARGARDLRRALAVNPYFDLRHAPRAEAALVALEASPGTLMARRALP